MDYLFEELGPERFQEFCQALLARAFPDVQCFPVAQPDGGRDAVVYLQGDGPEKAFNVFQVKYVRSPSAHDEPHRWIVRILNEELPKIQEQIPKGARGYYLLTNVAGTAHPGAGTIDLANDALAALGIPGFCWWRADLARRLDDAWDLKWAYPELIRGTDLLRLLVEHGLSEDRERRTRAIRTFVRAQYEKDAEVRFKQVELQNKLLDLFVDVPLADPDSFEDREGFYAWRSLPRVQGTEEMPGVATLILNSRTQRAFPQIVLEGAPGQGKSTLTQYVCQVHRMRLLDETASINVVPDHHRPRSVRIPIRVDLRDFATWLNKEDPFAGEDRSTAPLNWSRSLEAFLSALIRHQAGGVEFRVDDLHAVAALSALLIVLDGLDEVADIARRRLVVTEVKTGVARLREIAASLQVVVTSRPAAFANSPGFPPKSFPYFHLAALGRSDIDAYTERWLAAKRLSGKEAAEVRRILRQKLEQPHLMALARNPMQLAILLSLIHTRGASLPDKRTALYDAYVQLFFSRETEKSDVVRERRELLWDIHGYLAWVLHADAEKGHHSGNIKTTALQELIRTYLHSEGRNPDLVTELFSGMVERVMFLVARLEGTFEFEVQPVREYFAARFLYETAPYSPPGSERRGTKPDRFDALARNFYWSNVTRFYAGCFSKGELPSLIERLQDLDHAEAYRNTNHASRLAAMLLSDWVFSQNQRSTREAAQLVVNSLSLKHVFGSRRRPRPSPDASLVLPEGCGRRELVEACIDLLTKERRRDYAVEIRDLLRDNATRDEVDRWWLNGLDAAAGADLERWLDHGRFTGALSRCPEEHLERSISAKRLSPAALMIILGAGQHQFIYRSPTRLRETIEALLDGDVGVVGRARELIGAFGAALDSSRYANAFQLVSPEPMVRILARYESRDQSDESINVSDPLLQKCSDTVDAATAQIQLSAIEWATNLAPWETLLEKYREIWGERWIFYELATCAAGIRSVTTTCKDSDRLFDVTKPLARRFRYARFRSGAPAWWEEQLGEARTVTDRMAWALVLGVWASPRTILSLAKPLTTILNGLDEELWAKLARTFRTMSLRLGMRREPSLDVKHVPSRLSQRTAVVLGRRIRVDDAQAMYLKVLREYKGNDSSILGFAEETAWGLSRRTQKHWARALVVSRRSYAAGNTFGSVGRFWPDVEWLPDSVAAEIATERDAYSRNLIHLAAERCRLALSAEIMPLRDIAAKERWFA